MKIPPPYWNAINKDLEDAKESLRRASCLMFDMLAPESLLTRVDQAAADVGYVIACWAYLQEVHNLDIRPTGEPDTWEISVREDDNEKE